MPSTKRNGIIGTLETMFVRRMKDKQFTFLLAGRTWQAVDVDLTRSLVVAAPYSGGEAPRWHSAGGFLGSEVAEEMRDILISDEELAFVDNGGREEIQRMREELAPILSRDRCPMTWEKDRLRIHTYAGGRINATIAALVEDKGIAEVKGFGDLDIELRGADGNSPDPEKIQFELRKLRDADEHTSRPELARLVSEKQRGKLAKFQPYLPPNLEAAYLSERLFDVNGVSNLARRSRFEIA
jgi:ATP-dependent Lhr-like helicase